MPASWARNIWRLILPSSISAGWRCIYAIRIRAEVERAPGSPIPATTAQLDREFLEQPHLLESLDIRASCAAPLVQALSILSEFAQRLRQRLGFAGNEVLAESAFCVPAGERAWFVRYAHDRPRVGQLH